jgi:hypothetical protein
MLVDALDLMFSKALGIKNTLKLLEVLMPLFKEKSTKGPGNNLDHERKLTSTRFHRKWGKCHGLQWLDRSKVRAGISLSQQEVYSF